MRRRPPWSRLLLLILIAAAAVWVFQLRRERTRDRALEPIGLPVDFGDLARLAIYGPEDSIVVVRKGREFWLEHPVQDRADIFFLTEVRRQLKDLKATRQLPDTSGRDFGLDPPRKRLQVRSESGVNWGLALGDSSPVGSALYARRLSPGSHILLLDKYTARRYFDPLANTLRDPVGAPTETGPIDSIAVLVPGRELRARRGDRGLWSARVPGGLDLDPAQVNQVVQALRGPFLIGFPEAGDGLSSLGLDPPRATWILYQGSRAETVRVGRPTPDQKEVYVLAAGRRAPAAAGTDFFKQLTGGWPVLADLRVVAAVPESVRALEFLPPQSGGYQKEGPEWYRMPGRRPLNAPYARESLERDLGNLCRMEWTRYPLDRQAPVFGFLRMRLVTASAAETVSLTQPGDSLGLARTTRRPQWGPVTGLFWQIWHRRSEHPE